MRVSESESERDKDRERQRHIQTCTYTATLLHYSTAQGNKVDNMHHFGQFNSKYVNLRFDLAQSGANE